MRVCKRCKKEKPDLKFGLGKTYKSGFSPTCNACINEGRIRGQQSHDRRLSIYGLSELHYMMLKEAQDNCCAICNRSLPHNKEDVDHDHKTGKVRGLLCHNCNIGIGLFQDDPKILDKAAAYLRKGNVLCS